MITNGVVSIEDGNKAAEEYAPARKVRVELTFAVPEGEDGNHHVLEVGKVADAHVKRLLGREVTATEVAATNAKPATARKKAEAKVPSDKDKLAQAAGLPTQDIVTGPVAPAKPAVVEPVQDDIDDLLGDAAPVPITDAELAKAAQNKNAQMKVKDPNFSVKIRALVVEYAGQPPKKITDVPVAKRQEFLDKLRDLS